MSCPPPKPSARLLGSIRPGGPGGHTLAARRIVSGIALFALALSRVLAPRVELELSWAARSPLTMVDLLRIEDQRVAAMIRFVP